MSEWKTTTLGDFISLQRGHDLPYHERRTGEIPVIGSGGVAGYHDTAVVSGPGITIGRAANLGIPTLIQEDFWPLNTTLYVTDFRGNDIGFTYYLLQSIDLSGFNSGSVQPMLNRNYIKDFTIKIPDRQEQKSISAVLGALDDKISVNDRISITADSLLKAHFAYVSRDAAREVNLGDLVEFKYGKALREENRIPGRIPVFGGNGVSGWHDVALDNGPGVIVGRKGANAGSVSWSQGAFWPIDTSFYVKQVSSNIPLEFIFLLLETAGLRSLVGDSAIPGLNRDIAMSCSVRLPEPDAIQRFAETATPLLALRAHVAEESRSIGELRGTLLPKLMSGQIRVRDAEKVVEGVT